MADLRLYEPIEYDAQATELIAQIDAAAKAGEPVNIHINSEGGNVFIAFSIFGALKNCPTPTTAIIDGFAISAASFVAMACDRIVMQPHAQFMIHEASASISGNAKDMAKMADDLSSISEAIRATYVERCAAKGLDEARIAALMKAETWIKASDALSLGLCDEVNGKVVTAEVATSVADRLISKPLKMPIALMRNHLKQFRMTTKNEAPSTVPEEQPEKVTAEAATELAALKAKIAEMADQLKALCAAEQEEMAAEAVAEGKVDAAQVAEFRAQFSPDRAGSAKMKAMLATIPARAKASSLSSLVARGLPATATVRKHANGEAWTIRDYEKKDPAALQDLRERNPAAYRELWVNTYKTQPR
jgi:ATP-dependent Clp protease protease subunit